MPRHFPSLTNKNNMSSLQQPYNKTIQGILSMYILWWSCLKPTMIISILKSRYDCIWWCRLRCVMFSIAILLLIWSRKCLRLSRGVLLKGRLSLSLCHRSGEYISSQSITHSELSTSCRVPSRPPKNATQRA